MHNRYYVKLCIISVVRIICLPARIWLHKGGPSLPAAGRLYSLIGCCKIHGINPLIYFTDTLIRIGSHSILRIDELLPGPDWKPQIPDHFIPHQGILEQAAKETQNS